MHEEEIEEMMFCKICKEFFLVRNLGRSEVCKCKNKQTNSLLSVKKICNDFVNKQNKMIDRLKDDSEAINKYLKGKKQ
jgi:hypothetical protein